MPPDRPLPPLLPKPIGSSRREGDKPTPRRRKRDAVSNACNNCKRRKTKCDGSRPRCSSCVERDLNCEFLLAPGVTNRQVEQQRVQNYRSVLELLRKGHDAESAEALRRIRDEDDIDTAVEAVAEARLLLGALSSNAQAPRPATRSFEENLLGSSVSGERRRLKSPFDDSDFVFERQYMDNARDTYVDRDVFVNLSTPTLQLSRWTTVSNDDELMSHLVKMAFTWDNIVEHLFFREIFEEDVAALDVTLADEYPGSFCSRFLINALLALCCIYTLDPVTFKFADDAKSRGKRWAEEAELLLHDIHQPSITLLQGLYCLFIYEGNIGEGTKSVQYFLRSMDVFKALNDESVLLRPGVVEESRSQRERQAMAWCLWGFYCVEWRSTEAFGFRKLTGKPKIDKLWREPDFPLRRPDRIGYWWCPYPISLQHQPSLQVSIRETDVQLSELAEEALNFLHPLEGEGSPLSNPARALQLYDAFVDWKLHCPSGLRFEEVVLPSAILLHVYVEMMLVALLRPFAGMTKAVFGRFNPRERCVAHACHLMSVIWTFRAFGQIRFEYYLNHPLGSVAYIMLLGYEDEPVQMDTLVRACQCLHEMRSLLPLATDVLSGIRAGFRRYGLQVPEYMSRYFGSLRHRADGLLHHTVAGLLPSSEASQGSQAGSERQLQWLLNEFGDIDIN